MQCVTAWMVGLVWKLRASNVYFKTSVTNLLCTTVLVLICSHQEPVSGEATLLVTTDFLCFLLPGYQPTIPKLLWGLFFYCLRNFPPFFIVYKQP